MRINWMRVAQVCFGIILIRIVAGSYVAAAVLVLVGIILLIKRLVRGA